MTIFKDITGQGENVVLLHGWGCDHRHMQPIGDQLNKRYSVLNYDLPGRGQSDWAEGTENIHDIADQLLANLPERAIYIGWSFGGLITMSIAARFPERVERIIGLGTTPKFIEADNWPGIPKPGFRVPFEEGISKMGIDNFFKQFCDIEFDYIEPRPDTYHALIDLIKQTNEADLDILYKGIDICDTTDLREEFKTLQCPIDLIMGGKDDSAVVAGHEYIKALNSNVNIHVIKNAHHMPFWTHQAEFNQLFNSLL